VACVASKTGLLVGGNVENRNRMLRRNPPHPAIPMQMPSVSAMPRPPMANIQPRSSRPVGRSFGMNDSGPCVLST
jgi:hypothetical protein